MRYNSVEVQLDDISASTLTLIMPNLTRALAEVYAPLARAAFMQYQINTLWGLSAFFGNTAVESGEWTKLQENLDYKAIMLTKSWPARFPATVASQYARHPEMIANRAYANRDGNGPETSGDGWRYRGRGLIQLTGRSQYAQFTKDTGIDALGDPELLATPRYAVLSACWYWRKKHLMRIADAGQFETVAFIINGVRPPDRWPRREFFRIRAAAVLRWKLGTEKPARSKEYPH